MANNVNGAAGRGIEACAARNMALDGIGLGVNGAGTGCCEGARWRASQPRVGERTCVREAEKGGVECLWLILLMRVVEARWQLGRGGRMISRLVKLSFVLTGCADGSEKGRTGHRLHVMVR